MAIVDTNTNIPHGKDTKLFVDRYDLSGFGNAVAATHECEEAEASVFGRFKHFKAGQRSVKLKVDGVYEMGTDGIRAIAESLMGQERKVFVYALGLPTTGALDYLVAGAPCVAGLCVPKSYSVSSKVKEVVAVSWELNLTDPYVHKADVLAHTAQTASDDGDTVDATAARIGASGGAGYLSAQLLSGAAAQTLDVVIQHSANGTDWSTLITFAQLVQGVTTNFAQRVTCAGAVYRYRRAVWTIAGSPAPTWQFIVALGEY
jgi:hypothetical protein